MPSATITRMYTPQIMCKGILFSRTHLCLLKNSDGTFTLPGGYLREGESPPMAAERTVRDQTDPHARVDKLVAAFSADDEVILIYKFFPFSGDRERLSDPAVVWVRPEAVNESNMPYMERFFLRELIDQSLSRSHHAKPN